MGEALRHLVFLNKTTAAGEEIHPMDRLHFQSDLLSLPGSVTGNMAQMSQLAQVQHQSEMDELMPLLAEAFEEIASTLSLVMDMVENNLLSIEALSKFDGIQDLQPGV